MQIDEIEFGARVKAIRSVADNGALMGQDRFLKHIGLDDDINQSGLSAIERGKPSYSEERLMLLAERLKPLGFEIPYIENGKDEGPGEPAKDEPLEILANGKSQDVVTAEQVNIARVTGFPMQKAITLDPVTDALVSCCVLLQPLKAGEREWVLSCLSGRYAK